MCIQSQKSSKFPAQLILSEARAGVHKDYNCTVLILVFLIPGSVAFATECFVDSLMYCQLTMHAVDLTSAAHDVQNPRAQMPLLSEKGRVAVRTTCLDMATTLGRENTTAHVWWDEKELSVAMIEARRAEPREP